MEGMVLSLLPGLWMMGVMGKSNTVYVSQSLNWTDAQLYCRMHHIDLVTIKDSAENVQIKKTTWLGMYHFNSSANWTWLQENAPLIYQAVKVWEQTYPNSESCVSKHTNGKWNVEDCKTKHEFYCLDDSLSLKIMKKTWEEALVHCRSLSSGQRRYDLASLITEEDHDFVKSQISGMVWTGLRFLGDRWMWVGGEDVQYDNISSCPENERCGGIKKSSLENYTITTCEEKFDFFCYRKPTAL